MSTAVTSWPFFDQAHRAFDEQLSRDVPNLPNGHGSSRTDTDTACRSIARALGAAGILKACVADADEPDAVIDSRMICLARETLAAHDGLTDFVFAMQGLGTGPLALAGTPAQREAVLPRVRSGEWIAAFALSEANAGSDVAAMSCTATRDGDKYVLSGEKCWISNGGIADVYVIFARTGEAPGARGISALLVFPSDPGFRISQRIDLMAPHPMATIALDDCRVPAARLIGEAGKGFQLAMRTLDVFRASVGAAATGLARRALAETIAHATTRVMFGATLADLQMTQSAIGTMATEIDASALLVYRAAWERDRNRGNTRTTREAAMAKLFATETAQRTVDRAVQLFGARGVEAGHIAERLYREVRALRIYEGASEVQQMVIARELLRAHTR